MVLRITEIYSNDNSSNKNCNNNKSDRFNDYINKNIF